MQVGQDSDFEQQTHKRKIYEELNETVAQRKEYYENTTYSDG